MLLFNFKMVIIVHLFSFHTLKVMPKQIYSRVVHPVWNNLMGIGIWTNHFQKQSEGLFLEKIDAKWNFQLKVTWKKTQCPHVNKGRDEYSLPWFFSRLSPSSPQAFSFPSLAPLPLSSSLFFCRFGGRLRQLLCSWACCFWEPAWRFHGSTTALSPILGWRWRLPFLQLMPSIAIASFLLFRPRHRVGCHGLHGPGFLRCCGGGSVLGLPSVSLLGVIGFWSNDLWSSFRWWCGGFPTDMTLGCIRFLLNGDVDSVVVERRWCVLGMAAAAR